MKKKTYYIISSYWIPMKSYCENQYLLFGKAYLHVHDLVKKGKASVLEEIVLGRAFIASLYPDNFSLYSNDYLRYK